MKKSQNKLILEYLKKGHSITPIEALVMFDCWALAQRIAYLRNKGHNIEMNMIESHGKRFAMYKIIKL